MGAEHRRPGRDRGARHPGGARDRAGAGSRQSQSAVGSRRAASAGRSPGVCCRTAASAWRWRRSCSQRCRCWPRTASRRARRAAARGDAAAAIEAADDARAVQPWASTPYLQLALLEEQQGNLGAGEPPHRRRARARSLRLEHLARSGARADQGWFHTEGAPEPATGRAAEPQVAALRGPPGPHVQVLRQVRLKLAHLTRARRPALLVAATLVAALSPLPGDAGAAQRPLATAIQDFDYTATHFDRVRAAGARTVKMVLPVAAGSRRTSGRPDFDPANPDDPRYDWSPYDEQVRVAVARGLEPLITIRAGAAVGRAGHGRPAWRPGIPTRPSSPPSAPAIARRYSGTVRRAAARAAVRGLERAQRELLPVSAVRERPALHARSSYRAMVNSFSAGGPRRACRQRRDRGRAVPVRDQPRERRVDRALPVHARRAVPLRAAEDHAELRPAAGRRRVEPPPLHVRRPDAPRLQPRRDLARRHAEDEEAP